MVYTGNNDNVEKPIFSLQQNSPNPFNPETSITFSLPAKKTASLIIYNVKGQIVKTLLNEELSAGIHTIAWNGKDTKNNPVGSGVYYYKLKTGKLELIRKMILLK